MNYAYDCHMHLLPLGHVSLSAYLEYASVNPISEAYAQVFAHDYVVSGILKKQGDVRNLVVVMEQPVETQLSLYEDDLRGIFSNKKPFISENGLSIANKGLSYDRLALCPLLMDFSSPKPLNLYYPVAPEHNIEKQAKEVLSGIQAYYENRPNGKLTIFPFIGINPLNHSAEYTERLLKTCFKPSGFLGKKKPAFTGVKVYPPMGFDPNPKDTSSKEKIELLYSFCEENKIPIVTHCDDQGFRMTSPEDSLLHTSPERWEAVLARHPNLYLNFAHFGEQYARQPVNFFQKQVAPTWKEKILAFMQKYPHVYADLSFDGVNINAWDNLCKLLQNSAQAERNIYENRLLFGTDWPLSLSKTQSAYTYWSGFAQSALSSDLMQKMLHDNPERFLHPSP